ncbi:MAG: AbrB/MazE/SpoVT family DNA-binding domain-containing protein [Steroidobacteraceae bacterium]
MRVFVKKWRNSAAVRIPAGVMQAARLGLEDEVDVREQDGQIVIEPIRSLQ